MSVQVEVHPHWRNDNLMAHAKQHNIAIMVSPMLAAAPDPPPASI